MKWLQVTEAEYGRRVLVNCEHVEAITDDGEFGVRIVMVRLGHRHGPDDWHGDGEILVRETFDQIKSAMGGRE